jgi:sulfate adenylyltransferase subunit 1
MKDKQFLNRALEPADVYERKSTFPVQTVIRPKQKNTTDFRGYAENCTVNIKVGDA